MNALDGIPIWLAILIAFFVVLGSTLVMLGALGFARLSNFYDRLHAPTLGTSWGTAGIIIASMLLASWLEDRIVIHELIIGTFIMLTTPVTLILLGRAALHRDRSENSPLLPENVLTARRQGTPQEGDDAGEPEMKLPAGEEAQAESAEIRREHDATGKSPAERE